MQSKILRYVTIYPVALRIMLACEKIIGRDDGPGVRRDRLVRGDQFLHQGVAEQPYLRVAAECGALFDERFVPLMMTQGFDEQPARRPRCSIDCHFGLLQRQEFAGGDCKSYSLSA